MYNELRDYYFAYKEYVNNCSKFDDRLPNVPDSLSKGTALYLLNRDENIVNKLKIKSTIFEKDICSFDPTEEFDALYFIRFDLEHDQAFLYNCNQNSETIRDIKITKTKTFGEQIDNGRRPIFSIMDKIDIKLVGVIDWTKE